MRRGASSTSRARPIEVDDRRGHRQAGASWLRVDEPGATDAQCPQLHAETGFTVELPEHVEDAMQR